MQQAILAVLYHSVKGQQDTERHRYCPDGTTESPSWCKFKREGSMDDKPHHLDPVFLNILRPHFERLSSPDLLERCLGGFTQNQNESFNALIWKRCPKHTYNGPHRVQTAMNLAVIQWNSGSETGRRLIFDKLGLSYGMYTREASLKKDNRRVLQSLHRETEQQKRKRVAIAQRNAQLETQKRQEEGKTYGRALFSGLTVDFDEWDSDDDMPLTALQAKNSSK
ncbi:hypothetical protein HOLleu_10266 [Holothuria leucospilota]|uniref:Uncharacterized protein n=1 Tax=Holothuria leucospilota TaxID=206669 RepID=A0A9Q1CE35_HOLLE|nr:hypothetical protein HOLleu_10266 [Holothuria leucospilota]